MATITIYARLPTGDVVAVDIAEHDVEEDVRKKVSEACGLREGRFEIQYDDGGLWEGAEVAVVRKDLLSVRWTEMWERKAEMEEVLEQDPDATVTVDATGLAGTISISAKDLPHGVRHLIVTSDPSTTPITLIGSHFLAACTNLTTLELHLPHVHTIMSHFLTDCTSLRDLVLPDELAEVGDFFLSGCKALRTVDLNPLRGITRAKIGFLASCGSLRGIDLTPLSNVTQIDGYFLSNSYSLTTIDLSPLRNVTDISDTFLYSSGLTSVDLSPLSSVQTIGMSFLRCCPGLTSVDLRPLTSVRSIGQCALDGPGRDHTTVQVTSGTVISKQLPHMKHIIVTPCEDSDEVRPRPRCTVQ
eukprot:TRINITY_DN34792_c0_g1_i1.p1 TRINITY_DN34792_c0_g1~~TRINITY_DN34792_c0_g1_i1.p1  ORF type:complete len:369 (+),score=48.61 TRINITY_DN34792_c0_g1_i1:37-1107(+)